MYILPTLIYQIIYLVDKQIAPSLIFATYKKRDLMIIMFLLGWAWAFNQVP